MNLMKCKILTKNMNCCWILLVQCMVLCYFSEKLGIFLESNLRICNAIFVYS